MEEIIIRIKLTKDLPKQELFDKLNEWTFDTSPRLIDEWEEYDTEWQ